MHSNGHIVFSEITFSPNKKHCGKVLGIFCDRIKIKTSIHFHKVKLINIRGKILKVKSLSIFHFQKLT